MSGYKSKTQNVEIQENGIIRNSKGYLIARLVDSIDFNGEHVMGIHKEETSMPSQTYDRLLEDIMIFKNI